MAHATLWPMQALLIFKIAFLAPTPFKEMPRNYHTKPDSAWKLLELGTVQYSNEQL